MKIRKMLENDYVRVIANCFFVSSVFNGSKRYSSLDGYDYVI